MSDMVDDDAAGHSMSRHALRLVLRVLRRQSNDAGTQVVRPMEINSEIRIAPICCRALLCCRLLPAPHLVEFYAAYNTKRV